MSQARRQLTYLKTEGNEESDLWEQEWLSESLNDTEGTKTLLAEKAVLLRIEVGSQEAGFLSAFCSVKEVPKLVIISNGKVLEDIEAGTSHGEFISRIVMACGGDDSEASIVPQPGGSAEQAEPAATQQEQPSTSMVAQTQPENSQVDALLAERRLKLEKIKKEKEQAEREALKVIAKARREEAEKAESNTPPSSRQNYVEQQRTRQKDAKVDKERVLRMIESDKAARREKEEQRRLLARAEAGSAQAEAAPAAPSAAQPSSSRSNVTSCALLIRLFDGTSIRARFDPSGTLSHAVRGYVYDRTQLQTPYSFRHMQTPQPNRTIEVAEENETLLSLGLCPSATLVLVPVRDYADAYETAGMAGVLNRGANMGFGLVSGAYGLGRGILGRITGYGGDGTTEGPYVAGVGDEREPSNVQGSTMAEGSASSAAPAVKIRTLADQRRENKDHEFYNGNQVRQPESGTCSSSSSEVLTTPTVKFRAEERRG